MKVLLADDSTLILARLQEMVSKYNHVEIVGSFKNGLETLDAMRVLKPDLAIVDIKMPGLNGLEVLREIRKTNITSKIIILSFYSSDIYKKKAIQLGADYFFNKAEDFDKVSQVIELMSEMSRE